MRKLKTSPDERSLLLYIFSDYLTCDSTVENGQLPDPAQWAVADVVNYFKATGFEEQATAFQDQVRLRKIPCKA